MRALVFTLTLLAPWALLAAPVRYTLDPEHTLVAFLVEHIGYAKTLGRFTEVSGELTYDAERQVLSDLRVVVQTASVDSDHQARDKHVRGGDFLDVENHPEMIFTAATLDWSGQGEGTVVGELNLLGESRPLSLSVNLNKADTYPFGHKRFTLGVSARGALKRSDYGMDYGVANALVGDEVELMIETEAIAQGK